MEKLTDLQLAKELAIQFQNLEAVKTNLMAIQQEIMKREAQPKEENCDGEGCKIKK